MPSAINLENTNTGNGQIPIAQSGNPGQSKGNFDAEKAFDYAEKAVSLGCKLGLFKNCRETVVTTAGGNNNAPQPPPKQSESGMKYVWYIVAGVLVLVGITAAFRFASKR